MGILNTTAEVSYQRAGSRTLQPDSIHDGGMELANGPKRLPLLRSQKYNYTFPPVHLQQIDAIKALGIRTVIWFVDDPYMTDQTVPIALHYDVVLTHERSTVQLYQQHGCLQVHHMPLAVNEAIYRPFRAEKSYEYDVCFIGVAFLNRVELFDAIAKHLSHRRLFIGGGQWECLNHYSLHKPFIHSGEIEPEEAAHYNNGSKIVINLHRTDDLTHEEERLRIAMRGLYRTLRDHTMTTRMASLLTLLK